MGDDIANFKKNLEVLDGSAQVPIGFNHVRRVVIVIRDVLGALRFVAAAVCSSGSVAVCPCATPPRTKSATGRANARR